MNIRLTASLAALAIGLSAGAASAQYMMMQRHGPNRAHATVLVTPSPAEEAQMMQEHRQSTPGYVYNPSTEAAAQFQDSFVTNDH